MKKYVSVIAVLFLAGCEDSYYPAVPAYAPLPEACSESVERAGYIVPPLGGGRAVGGYGYSGYGNNIMVTGPLGGPVGSTMVSGY